jgi:hypothetical protein
MISKIERCCSSYLNGFTDIANHTPNTKSKTALAALKIFTYIASLLVLPAIAFGVRFVCRKFSGPIAIVLPFVPPLLPNYPLPPSPSPVDFDKIPISFLKTSQVIALIRGLNKIKNSASAVTDGQTTKVHITMKNGEIVIFSSVKSFNSLDEEEGNPMSVSYFKGIVENNKTDDPHASTNASISVTDIAQASITTEPLPPT